MTKDFKKEELQAMVWGDSKNLVKREDNITSNSRWSIFHEVVFEDLNTNKCYSTSYSVGATEMQDESPFEYDNDEITCSEVELKEVVVKKWIAI